MGAGHRDLSGCRISLRCNYQTIKRRGVNKWPLSFTLVENPPDSNLQQISRMNFADVRSTHKEAMRCI